MFGDADDASLKLFFDLLALSENLAFRLLEIPSKK